MKKWGGGRVHVRGVCSAAWDNGLPSLGLSPESWTGAQDHLLTQMFPFQGFISVDRTLTVQKLQARL